MTGAGGAADRSGRERTGLTRRRLGAATLALGGALALAPFPAGPATAASPNRRPTLRHGSPERAGLLAGPLRQLVADAEKYLGTFPGGPKHPWYAGAVLLAGRGGTVALHQPIGKAVRYAHYDDATDTGVEFPADQQIDMAEDTVFDLASVSKLFTSILAVQEIERGHLELETKVASYLPDFAGAGKQDVTIRQLLTHTSGFTAWIPLYKEPNREGQVRLIWNQPLLNPPGTKYLYSDLNLISLQLVLEKLTGKTLDVLLRERITGPLGMTRTRYNPPADWKPKVAATEDARAPWSGLNRGLVWGEVHDENAYGLGGVAGHAGVFSTAWDLAVLGRTLLNGGVYGDARILSQESVDLMFTDFNQAFPGDEHGLGFELYQHWYMGAMATPRTAGHTGFTGTSIVLDPTTDSFLIVLGNSVHPVRNWRSGSAPRVAAGTDMARAVAVRPAHGRAAWFSGMASATSATLTLPDLQLTSPNARLSCALWWDTEPHSDFLFLEASTDGGTTWKALPFTTDRTDAHDTGSVDGWSGRTWHHLAADLGGFGTGAVRVRWRYTTDQLYVGRGVYVDGIRVTDGRRVAFDASRPADSSRIEAAGWTESRD
ncbi:serine hydrolase [Streptomyces sp. VRA16 Mangrove soil]|uniref:serine hydrolase n=1 Tax=Streptomyces sp. VRA16 Mangrove soil TaxID=2817434 RepID=UPI001A9F99AD|nr:serine hydrolase [Streptomyces sp. VRA16 Mangrove soil]MBO1332963.1 serine hydrolase [Streptomyces sp. VRA16 Mangrove soil]